MDKFEIGEIAILHIYDGDASLSMLKRNGSEVEIIGRRKKHPALDVYVYEINSLDDGSDFAWEGHLKKRPPHTELSTWEEVQKITGWHPTKQRVDS